MTGTRRLLGRTAAAIAVVGTGLVVSQVNVSAQTATATLTVSASVAANCQISTSPLSFGAYDPIVTHATLDLSGTGTVTITCTSGAVTTIALNLGSNPSASQRRMAGPSTNYLNYEIYQDAAHTTVWGSSGAGLLTPPVAPSYAPRSFTAFGVVTAGQDVIVGAYTDSVTATVNF